MIQSLIMKLQYRGSRHSAEDGPHVLGGLKRNHKGLLALLLFLEKFRYHLLKGMFVASSGYCRQETTSMD